MGGGIKLVTTYTIVVACDLTTAPNMIDGMFEKYVNFVVPCGYRV